MTAIETPHEAGFSIPGGIAKLITTMRALSRQAVSRIFAGFGQAAEWRTLDERLLRDIGASALAAELERDALASGGLSSDQFMRWIRSDCRRNGL